jgi:uncharacterized delta-60 repeat protein
MPGAGPSRAARKRAQGARLRLELLENRLAPASPGALDPTFGAGGLIDFGATYSEPGNVTDAARVAVRSDGRIIVVGSVSSYPGAKHHCSIFCLRDTGAPLSGPDTWATMIPFSSKGNDEASAVALDSVGRIVVAGSADPDGLSALGNRDFAVLRLTADGTLDSTFGNGGKVRVPFDLGGMLIDEAQGVAIDNQGRVLVAGTVATASGARAFGIVRLTPHGQLDTSFNTTGKVVVPFNLGGWQDASACGIALDSQGRILVAGTATGMGLADFAVVRLTPAGQLDTTFGGNGRQTVAFTPSNKEVDQASGLAIDSQDRILVGGTTATEGMGSRFAVTRLTSGGQLDSTFNGSGRQTISFGPGTVAEAHDLALDPQGRIVLVGTAQVGGMGDFATVRLTAAGQLDGSFSNNAGAGQSLVAFAPGGAPYSATAQAVAIDREGRVLVAGAARENGHDCSALARLEGGSFIHVADASGDSTPQTVFRDGAIRVSYDLGSAAFRPVSVCVEALQNGLVTTLATRRLLDRGGPQPSRTDTLLVDLARVPQLTEGDYQVRVRASGLLLEQTVCSATAPLKVLTGVTVDTPDRWSDGATFTSGAGAGTGQVLRGAGGTSTLYLQGVQRQDIMSVNGLSLDDFIASHCSTYRQAVYQGSAYDYLCLKNGREIYFQDMEHLRLADGTDCELAVHPTDPELVHQWDLQMTDVPDAWRFTTGENNVLLVSLDSGILNPPWRWVPKDPNKPVGDPWSNPADWTKVTNVGGIQDIDTARLLTDAAADDNTYYPGYYGHGHAAISLMAATANNGNGITGINWGSRVLVRDVTGWYYNGGSWDSLQQAIADGLAEAANHGQRVVFQGGIQGEFFLTDGGTQADLEKLFSDHGNDAVFAIAAGNGDQDMSLTTGNSAGVARLAGSHANVLSVGAVLPVGTVTIDGLENAWVKRAEVWNSDGTVAWGSNYGSQLTLVAPAQCPAMDKFGLTTFSGTSCANPIAAGIASLVWSVNPGLRGDEVRQVLTDTATDLGTPDKPNGFGAGLVNAGAAVRRASALARDRELALLYSRPLPPPRVLTPLLPVQPGP